MNDKSTRTARSRSYSDWQVRRIRYALKAHHSAQSAGEKRIESWRYIAETVDGYHGVEATPREIARFAERIRQFVEGVPKPKAVEKAFGKGYIREKEKEKENEKKEKEGEQARKKDTQPLSEAERQVLIKKGLWAYPVPQRLPEIVECIIDPETGFLPKSSLQEYAPDFEAPLRLTEYLDPDFDQRGPGVTSHLIGAFRSRRQVMRGERLKHVQNEIDLHKAVEFGIIYLTEVEEWFEIGSWDELDALANDEIAEVREGVYEYGGWGVVSPTQSVFAFLKELTDEESKAYLSVAVEEEGAEKEQGAEKKQGAGGSGTALKTMYLLPHEAPIKYSTPSSSNVLHTLVAENAVQGREDKVRRELGEKLARGILVFHRISGRMTG